ncbi:bifunctional phosphoribosyl-AMP cyclohydrolase/phosphoribosyl-ATP diphosphatase HisIE [Thermomonas sp. HDW16]|uniref:bifunctional phosphoribosyl-AMP cyclohydrolase/phosphoribosyl-ATP diphosphatase HisIE n=1 Tax=Thermomonas sp. HDW16 TaxID=2714945 RepID=UPI001F0D8497|nr:bifunctional phosphoribosyl-AMP cyclohydrolase/phosphoribosyl-ATP diphosphatase HisIE [Thermomonas sp. HDW16]
MADFDIESLDWDKQGGLLPAIVQDAANLRVLMLGYMSRASLAVTLESGQVTFFSRSKQRLWVKGETSGNTLAMVSVAMDCDADALLVQARPQGPTCHTGAVSCFVDAPADVLGELDRVIARRKVGDAEASYTRKLFDAGIARIAQKVGEEGVETALAAVTADDAALCGEAADLVYHLLVLLQARGLAWDGARAELARRAKG